MPKQGMKEVPSKINDVIHCPDEVLQKPSEITYGYRNKTLWSTQTNDTRCQGNDRTFDKIVAQSVAKENYEINREKKLQEYYAQPQRGTMRGGKDGSGAEQMRQAKQAAMADGANYINRVDN